MKHQSKRIILLSLLSFAVISIILELAAYSENYKYGGGFFSFNDLFVTIFTPLISFGGGVLLYLITDRGV